MLLQPASKRVKVSTIKLPAKFTLMVQGTTSDAGKSVLTAGLCRLLSNAGFQVAPFKPQNMALNSAVTKEGGEIGRAQALQAMAARVEPQVHMNPVLIKPASDTGAQIIIQGQARHDMTAQSFHAFKPQAMAAVMDSYRRLQENFSIIVVEGAGSPAEINLREGDIANMGFAEAADCPVILVADIDKGGVFAHLVGTLALLSESERARTIGFVINKFRGDIALLTSGLDWLERQTGKPVLGVVPFIKDFYVDAEDAIDTTAPQKQAAKLKILVPVLPRISNHTDFDALRLHPQIDLSFVPVEQVPPSCDVILLPGSKNVRADLAHLKSHQWQSHLDRHLRYGGKVMGICGGFQMLGQQINDPHGIEDTPGSETGLGYLPIRTELHQQKQLQQVNGSLLLNDANTALTGYEIHCGQSIPSETNACAALIKKSDGSYEGMVSNDQQIVGTYCHGLFDHPAACSTLLDWMGLQTSEAIDMNAFKEKQLECLSATLTASMDLAQLNKALQQFYQSRAQ